MGMPSFFPRSPPGDLLSWRLLAAMTVFLLPLAWETPFAVAPDKAVLPGLGLAFLAGVAVAGRILGMPRLRIAGVAFLQLTLFTIGGVALSYMLAARGGPLWDARFAAWDVGLGVNWPALRKAVDASNGLVWVLELAYNGIVPQMIVVVVALSALARFAVLRVTVAAAIIAGLLTIAISAFMPADGNLFDPAVYRHLWAPVALNQAGLIAGLRDGTVRTLDLSAMQGIVTFPSYHAALAAIFVYAFRPIPKLAVPGGLWAGLTILATPLGGGHYAVDVIAGLGLAFVSLLAARRLVAGEPPPRFSVEGAGEAVGSVQTSLRTR